MGIMKQIEKEAAVPVYRRAQVKMDDDFFKKVKEAMAEDGFDFQDVLLGGLKQYMEERKRKVKNG